MSVQVGAAAPEFDLESDDGKRLSLEDFDGKWLVLYFYPRDNTPGCTREAQDFTGAAGRLRKLGAEVVGVSKDSVKSHCGFRDKFDIGFPLLSDPDLAAHKAYGAWGPKTLYGKTIEGTLRSTFLIAPDGTIAQIWKSVKVDGHAEKVIAALSAAPATKASVAKKPATKAGAGKNPAAKTGAAKTKARRP
jgi:thioredoxin-dependent peroxiredoxin